MTLEFLDHAPREALAAEAFIDEDIAEPGEGRAIGDDARKANRRARGVIDRNRRDAVAECLGNNLAADVRRPVGGGQDAMDGVEVLAAGVEGDRDRHLTDPSGVSLIRSTMGTPPIL